MKKTVTRKTRKSAPQTDAIARLQDLQAKFAAARDWEQFHTPKNLAAALAVEASELLEHFQWLTPEQSANLTSRQRTAVAMEAADVLLYLVRLCDRLEIDVAAAAERKIVLNARKYPVSKSRGRAKR
jgi:dCTP diphosphatase